MEGRKEGRAGEGEREGLVGGVALASTPDEEGRGRKKEKKVLARLKKLGRPLKTIRLMKYVKAHKETLRPFKGVRRGRMGGGQEAGKTHRVSIFRRKRETHEGGKREKNLNKPSRYALVGTSRETRRRRRGGRKK